MLGSLHIDAEDEPRRGASRANSVRFDETALHGHFAHASRSSSDFFPIRTGSGLGSHPMTERSSSHKSEGKQGVGGPSNNSTRLNSLGLDVRQPVLSNSTPIGPPPGFFLLGPLPSIIRCWLDTNFSNDTLLYAVICTGSYKSVLSSQLAQRLGLEKQATSAGGDPKVKLQVYLPEATFQHSSARSTSPTPQLPQLTIEFHVQHIPEEPASIQIFIGSDVLRAKNADILMSQDRMTIFDDDRNKLAIPLIRPEHASMYQNLLTVSRPADFPGRGLEVGIPRETPDNPPPIGEAQIEALVKQPVGDPNDGMPPPSDVFSPLAASAKQPSIIGDGRKATTAGHENGRSTTAAAVSSDNNGVDSGSSANGITPDTPTKADTMWGSWRRDSTPNARADPTFSSIASTSGYQRAGRGRGMKVLKPARSNASSRTISAAVTTGLVSSPDVGAVRPLENGNGARGTHSTAASEASDSVLPSPGLAKKPFSSAAEAKSPVQPAGTKPRGANPIGGASAFGWLNAAGVKQPVSSPE